MDHLVPSADEAEDLLLSCRYGDVDDIKSFIDRFGTVPVGQARDENGNTVLHMACANGHIQLLHVLLPIVLPSLLSAQNSAGSTALHWAALNSQLATARALVEYPPGPGVDLIDIRNAAGRSPLGEAEAAQWDEGAKWMVEVMRLDSVGVGESVDDASPSEHPADIRVDAPSTNDPATVEKGEARGGPPSW